jgi:large subunit ribosomal protein L4e
MAARPQVSIQNSKDQVVLPAVFLAPIRPDVVQFVHTNMNKNNRQPTGVDERTGMGHSAESWGTGRAVARIPRVSGGGSSAAGQGAFGNMCRGGRMFANLKTWRKWHRKINVNQRRYATASALAASALPALVAARGHRIENVAEVPCVLDNSVESLQKTKQAIEALKKCGAYTDVEKVIDSKKLRRGVGKTRGRRHVMRKGPLVVYQNDNGITRAFRNLPGVELCQVSRLNLLQLAPGGHVGRFIIWTQGAFTALNEIFGSVNRESTQKKGYKLPRPMMANSDLTRLINSDEVQSKVRPAQRNVRTHTRQKKNPLTNLGQLVRINPYALATRRSELQAQERRAAGKTAAKDNARRKAHAAQQKENWARLSAEGKVDESDNEDGSGADSEESGSAKGVVIDHSDISERDAAYITFEGDNALGKKAPSLGSLNYVQGDAVKGDKPYVVLFWAQYHKPGFNKFPLYSDLAKKFAGKVDFVAVSMDPSDAAAKKFLDDPAGKYSKVFPLTFPVAHDVGKKLQQAYEPLLRGPVNIPHAFVVSKSGVVVWRQDHSQVGATAPTHIEQVTRQLEHLVNGTPMESNGENPWYEESDEEESDEEESEDE